VGLGGLHLVCTQTPTEPRGKSLLRCRCGQGLALPSWCRRNGRRFLQRRRLRQRWRRRRPDRRRWNGSLGLPRACSADNAKDLPAPRTADPVVALDADGSHRDRRVAVVRDRFRPTGSRRHGRNRKRLPAGRTGAMCSDQVVVNLEPLLTIRANNHHFSPLPDASDGIHTPSIKHFTAFASTIFRRRKIIMDCTQLYLRTGCKAISPARNE